MYPERKCEKCGFLIPKGSPYCPGMPCQSFAILKIEKPEEGGTLSWLDQHRYPFNGLPPDLAVDRSAIFKRAIIATLRLATARPIKYFLPLLLFLFPKTKKRLVMQVCFWIAEIYTSGFNKSQIPPKEFCNSARELLRAGTKLIDGIEDKYTHDRLIEMLWSVVMVWEFDNAYRFRGQDILSELNRYSLAENPKKEILRLLELGLVREKSIITEGVEAFKESGGFDLGEKWRTIISLVRVLLWAFPAVVNPIKDFLMELDLDKIAFDTNDKYFVYKRFDYNYGGMTYEERKILRDKMDEGWVAPVIPKTAQVGLQPNLNFFLMDKEHARNLVNTLVEQFFLAWEQNKQQVLNNANIKK